MPVATGIRSDLEPGRVVLYFGPRRGWLRRRGIASGKVLSINEEWGVVHIRTYRAGSSDATGIEVEVGHIPIAISALNASLAGVASVSPTPVQIPSSVYEWNERHGRGDVGAFSVELFQAEQLAWEAARVSSPDASPVSEWIEYAFPKRGADGAFRIVEVAVRAR